MFQLFLVLCIPAVGALGLWLVLGRWSKRHDPMGGSTESIWSTTGTQSHSESDGD